MDGTPREPVFTAPLDDDLGTVLFAERLRDGRIALGTRTPRGDGEWEHGELHLLSPSTALALTGWLAPVVSDAWLATVRERGAEQLRTAYDLHGEGVGAVQRLALDVLQEIPPELLVRALLLLINSIGPEARQRRVERLNRTPDRSEEAALRRQLVEEREAFAYAIAAAALFDALAQGLPDEEDGSG
ncbi:MAG TPA: hypothetical protein VGR27_04305 [Longimicrobiaceae bacterium]|nr:hypothetical protein [Longimicrobiaceae bacterium]